MATEGRVTKTLKLSEGIQSKHSLVEWYTSCPKCGATVYAWAYEDSTETKHMCVRCGTFIRYKIDKEN